MKLRNVLRPAIAGMLIATLFLGGCGYFTKAPAPKLGASYYPGTLTSLLPNYPQGPFAFTATSQTATIALSGQSWEIIEFTATTCTTITFQFKGSMDTALNATPQYLALAAAPYVAGTLVPSTSAVTLSANTTTWYVVNVAGFSSLQIITSSTFTATGVNFYVNGTSNPGLITNIG